MDWIEPSLKQIQLIDPAEVIICEGCFFIVILAIPLVILSIIVKPIRALIDLISLRIIRFLVNRSLVRIVIIFSFILFVLASILDLMTS